MAKQDSCRHDSDRPSGSARQVPICRARATISRRTRSRFALCGILLFLANTAVHAEWLIDADAGVFYDNNLGRASSAADFRAGSAATFAFAASWFAAPTESDGLSVSAAVGGEAHDRYHGLNNGWAVGTALYRHKFGVGLAAPWVLFELAGGYYEYDFNVRTGARFALRAEMGKRLSETFDIEIGAFYDRRYGPFGEPVVPDISGQVFNLRGEGVYLRAGYAVTENLLLGARLAVRRGDVVSTTSRNYQIFLASTAIAEDRALGDELYAYRLRGTTRTAVLTLSWALNARSSLNLSYTGEATSVMTGLDYRSSMAALTYSYRY